MTPVDIDKLKELLADDTREQDDIRYYSGTSSSYAPKREALNEWLRSNAAALIAKAERLDALMDLIRRAQLNVPEYYVDWHEAARNALSPKESE